MITLMTIDKINQNAKKIICNNTEDKLIVIDLKVPTKIENTSPELLVAKLIPLVTDKVKDIYLVTPELSRENLMSVYAHKLAAYFAEVYQIQLLVHIVSSLEFDSTLISMQEENFQIHGVSSSTQTKKMIWEGQDILSYMDDPQRSFTGVSYVWEI